MLSIKKCCIFDIHILINIEIKNKMHEYSFIYEFINQHYIIIDSKQRYAYYNDMFVRYLK